MRRAPSPSPTERASALGHDTEATGVLGDRDAALLIGAQHRHAETRWPAAPCSAPDDRRSCPVPALAIATRASGAREEGRILATRAVMRDLQHVRPQIDPGGQDPRLTVRLHVTGEQDRQVVDTRPGGRDWRRSPHPTRPTPPTPPPRRHRAESRPGRAPATTRPPPARSHPPGATARWPPTPAPEHEHRPPRPPETRTDSPTPHRPEHDPAPPTSPSTWSAWKWVNTTIGTALIRSPDRHRRIAVGSGPTSTTTA